MTPSAATAIMAMGQCVTTAEAEDWARKALERGATHAEITEAWREWRELRASETQTIRSFPRADTLCACADILFWHEDNTGRCLIPGCGCRWARPGGKRWTA